MQKIKKVAIIGTGVIGAGWIIRCLAKQRMIHPAPITPVPIIATFLIFCITCV